MLIWGYTSKFCFRKEVWIVMSKILVVDDDKGVLMLLKELMNENGYEADSASNGLSALALFETRFYDCIITDLRMPSMDGMAFLNEVKRLEPVVPVIVLTAYNSTETAIQSIEKGAFHYMAKPFKANELLKTVKCAIDAAKKNNGKP